jgi:hypothetical protein
MNKPALPKLGKRVTVLANSRGNDLFSGEYYVVQHTVGRDIGLASHPDDEPSFWVDISRLDWS